MNTEFILNAVLDRILSHAINLTIIYLAEYHLALTPEELFLFSPSSDAHQIQSFMHSFFICIPFVSCLLCPAACVCPKEQTQAALPPGHEHASMPPGRIVD